MKREAATHPKLYDLAARLEIDNAHALGLLQGLIWFTADHAISGDVGKWPDGAISGGSGWRGDAGHFVRSLEQAGWLDAHDEHRLVMHDWPDHCEAWVRAKMTKMRLQFLPVYGECGPLSGDLSAEPSAVAIGTQTESGQERTQKTATESGQENALPPGVEPSTNQTEPNQTEPNRTKPKKGREPPLIPEPLARNTEFCLAWQRWMGYRHRRRLTNDPETIQAQLAALEKVGAAKAVEAIGVAIQGGWSGVFPDKSKATANRTRSKRHGQ